MLGPTKQRQEMGTRFEVQSLKDSGRDRKLSYFLILILKLMSVTYVRWAANLAQVFDLYPWAVLECNQV